MRQYEMTEWSFPCESESAELCAVILNGDWRRMLRGFRDGRGNMKLRFLPLKEGEYKVRFIGLVDRVETHVCEKAEPNRHGPVRVEGTHFRYDDGTWFYPFGTTVYALVHQEQSLIEQTMATLRENCFNKVRICVFPKSFPFNENEPPFFPFEKAEDGWDMGKPVLEYWDELEKRISELNEMCIQCDLILLHPYDRWGFARLSPEQVEQYFDYAARRLSAFPNLWWSLANEYDLLPYSDEEWAHFASVLAEADPYGHLLSNHQMLHPWDFSNPDTTHICLQLKNVDDVSRWVSRYCKPLMVDECRYEGNIDWEWGNISAFELVDRFWKIVCQGGYASHGETFLDENDILWWAKGGILKGKSPQRIAFLKSIVESLPGPLSYSDRDWTWEEISQHLPDFLKNQTRELGWEQLYPVLMDMKRYAANCSEEAYLIYYSRHTVAWGELDLPEDGLYRVERLDAWEMTRTVVDNAAHGRVRVPMPSKEGMALLAVKNQ